jgi:hypothetical protein
MSMERCPTFYNYKIAEVFSYCKKDKLFVIIIMLNKWTVEGTSCWSKIPRGSPTIRIIQSTSTKTPRPAHASTSPYGRLIRAYSIGLTSLGKLSCPKKKKKKLMYVPNQGILKGEVSLYR